MPIFVTKSASLEVHLRHPVRVHCDGCGTRFIALGARDISHTASDTNLGLLLSSSEQRATRVTEKVANELERTGRVELRAYCVNCRLPVNIDQSASGVVQFRSQCRASWTSLRWTAAILAAVAAASVLLMNVLPAVAWIGWIALLIIALPVLGVIGALLESRPLAPSKPLRHSLAEAEWKERGGEADTVRWALATGTPAGQGHVVIPRPLLDWTFATPGASEAGPIPS